MTEEDKSIIENQIKLMNEISLKNKSETANKIIKEYLQLSIDYSLILLDKNTLYEKIDSDKKEVDNAIDLLTENNILNRVKENDTTYYSLNLQYFNDNDI